MTDGETCDERRQTINGANGTTAPEVACAERKFELTVVLTGAEAGYLTEFVGALEAGEVPDTAEGDIVTAALRAAVDGSEGGLKPVGRVAT